MASPLEWQSQQITEFLAVVSSYTDELSALEGAVEHAASALEAEVAAVVCGGRVMTSLGFGQGKEPDDALVEVAARGRGSISVPGAGECLVLAVPLDDAGVLLVARSGDDFTRQEEGLLRGLARALTLTLRMLSVVDAERRLRLDSEEQARENLRLLGAVRERQTLLEHLFRIQRSISQRAPLRDILDSIADGAAELLDGTAAIHIAGDDRWDDDAVTTTSPRAPTGEELVVLRDARETIGARAARLAEPVVSGASAAAPIHCNGRIVGTLVVVAGGPRGRLSDADRAVVVAFAEHASVALNDASAVHGMRRAFDDALHQATHDALTGLPNRALVLDRLSHALSLARRTGTRVAVLFVDLDRFKVVNDSLGHNVGDQVLIGIAERLAAAVREGDTVGRLAGDEFVVICEEVEGVAAVDVAARVAAAVAEPMSIGGRDAVLTASIGIAHAEPGTEAEDVLRDADVAMYRAKERGRSRIERFDREMRNRMLRRLETEAALRTAMHDGRLRLDYQPIVCAGDLRLVAVEALVRWDHPDRGLTSPMHFIPLAEESGLILPLGRWILNEACAQLAAWRTGGFPHLRVTVNLSARQFTDPDLVDMIRDALHAAGLPGDALWVEITESVLMEEAEATVETLRVLKTLGLHLSVDDFGTGYSSLSYLKRFPVDALKIDRSFVDGLGADAEDDAIVTAVVGLARALNLAVVAEGVEKATQLAELQRLGCNAVQGYLVSRPLPPERFGERLLRRPTTGAVSLA